MTNIVAFPDPKADSDARLVEILEGLLEDAKAGRVRSFAGVVFHRDTHAGQRYCHEALTMEGVGAVQLLLSWMIQRWEGAPNLPDTSAS